MHIFQDLTTLRIFSAIYLLCHPLLSQSWPNNIFFIKIVVLYFEDDEGLELHVMTEI